MRDVFFLIRSRLFRAAAIKAWDTLCRSVAWCLPRRLVMWAYFRVVAEATTGEHSNTEVPALTAMDAIKCWDID